MILFQLVLVVAFGVSSAVSETSIEYGSKISLCDVVWPPLRWAFGEFTSSYGTLGAIFVSYDKINGPTFYGLTNHHVLNGNRGANANIVGQHACVENVHGSMERVGKVIVYEGSDEGRNMDYALIEFFKDLEARDVTFSCSLRHWSKLKVRVYATPAGIPVWGVVPSFLVQLGDGAALWKVGSRTGKTKGRVKPQPDLTFVDVLENVHALGHASHNDPESKSAFALPGDSGSVLMLVKEGYDYKTKNGTDEAVLVSLLSHVNHERGVIRTMSLATDPFGIYSGILNHANRKLETNLPSKFCICPTEFYEDYKKNASSVGDPCTSPKYHISKISIRLVT